MEGEAYDIKLSAQFNEGYTLRNLLCLVKSETPQTTMIFTPDAIEISFINQKKYAVHVITIQARELQSYHYKLEDAFFAVGFNTVEMYNTTKGIGRRDGMRLHWGTNDKKLTVQLLKTGAKGPGRNSDMFVQILPLEHVRYGAPPGYADEPNVRVQSKEFSEICSQANTAKCSHVEFQGHSHGVTLTGFLPDRTESFISQFLSPPPPENPSSAPGSPAPAPPLDEVCTVTVPIMTVKALSKIHNIGPTGALLKFYFAADKPVKISCPIGSYGTYTLCLRNPLSS